MRKRFCKNGHDTFVCGRDTHGSCIQCVILRATKWNKTHSVRRSKICKKYRKNNSEKEEIYKKQWNIKNPAYWCYKGMIHRCYVPTAVGYKYYGGRGIKVCDRWLGKGGYENFVKDMGPRPSKKHTIDRKNFNGNYEPDNCRWSTQEEQHKNRRRKITVTPEELELIYVIRKNNISLTDLKSNGKK